LIVTVSGVFVSAFLVFVGVMIGMSAGVILSGRRIKGSCGGLAAWRDDLGNPVCDACVECPEKKGLCELEGEARAEEPSAEASHR
jgi:hypothetical protein